jgi:hypothetical protein
MRTCVYQPPPPAAMKTNGHHSMKVRIVVNDEITGAAKRELAIDTDLVPFTAVREHEFAHDPTTL